MWLEERFEHVLPTLQWRYEPVSYRGRGTYRSNLETEFHWTDHFAHCTSYDIVWLVPH